MKRKFFIFFIVALSLAALGRVHAGGAASAAVATVIEGTQLEVLAENVMQYYQMLQSWVTMIDQLKYGIKTADAALKNLESFDPSQMTSLNDWMNFANRQMDMERRVEDIFSNVQVKVGNNDYNLKDIDKIPDDVESGKTSLWEKEISEEERRRMWIQAGLSPANYAYMKTWQTREKDAGEKIAGLFDGGLAKEQAELAGKRGELENEAGGEESNAKLTQDVIKGQGITDQHLVEIEEELAVMAERQNDAEKERKYIPQETRAGNPLKEKSPYETAGKIDFGQAR